MSALQPIPCLFWSSIAALAYTFAGYPLLIRLLAAVCHRPPRTPTAQEPRAPVSVVIAVYEEADRIAARLNNLLDSTYPADRLEIIVVADGSADTAAAATSLADPRIRLLAPARRRGKAACLNDGVAAATGDLVVFADARQEFEPTTIPELVAPFDDPAVGAVSGELLVRAPVDATGSGVDAYWRLEKIIRRAEARVDSCIGCTGAVYAIRRRLYDPIPDDTILDDVLIPMRILTRGYRVLFRPEARAHDPQPLAPATERRRKQRTLAGNIQLFMRYPGWLLPWHNRCWWQLLSHKYLRMLGPLLLLAAGAANTALLASPPYPLLFAAQALLYTCAIIGRLAPTWRTPILAIPAGFLFLNLQVLRAYRYYWRGQYRHGWHTTTETTQAP